MVVQQRGSGRANALSGELRIQLGETSRALSIDITTG